MHFFTVLALVDPELEFRFAAFETGKLKILREMGDWDKIKSPNGSHATPWMELPSVGRVWIRV